MSDSTSDYLFPEEEPEAEDEESQPLEEAQGRCPRCGGPGEMLSAGARHWMVCHHDRVKWAVGVGFILPLQTRREKWDHAPEIIAAYEEVEPVTGAGTDDTEEIARFRRLLGE